MPSYSDLQAELEQQVKAWNEYANDLRLRAQEFCDGFGSYLDVPQEPLTDRRGNTVPYVDMGTGSSRSFRPCYRVDLPVEGENISFAMEVNIEHSNGYDAFYYELHMSKAAGHYDINVAEPSLRFHLNGVSAPPDFTEIYEALSRNLLQQLQRRP